jgi:hypothetical protein
MFFLFDLKNILILKIMINIKKNKNLKKFNFYNLNVRAKYFVELKNKNDFVEIFE